MKAATAFDEKSAREVLLLEAVESTQVEAALWSAEDRAWASRLARETVPADADAARFLRERAHHAMQRMLPRDPALRAALAAGTWRPARAVIACAVAFLIGLLVPSIGADRQIDLLAPPVWAVVAWNLGVLLWLLVSALRGDRAAAALRGPRAWWSRFSTQARPRAGGPIQRFASQWALHGAALTNARLDLVFHAAAVTLGLGLVAGLYARGLVFDFRAAWQSTFLGADTVQALLSAGLAPASALTGLPVPDVAPLRIGAGGAAAGPAAVWIHLYAATVLLFVLVPRGLLAAWAGWRSARGSKTIPLSLEAPYFQRLLRERSGGEARVQVLSHGSPLTAQAALGLRALLAPVLGDTLQLQMSAVTPYGQEEQPVPAAETGTTWRIACFDLGATPEVEAQGRLLHDLRAASAVPVLVLVDESAFVQRFASMPARIEERREAWRRFAQSMSLPVVCVALLAPDAEAARRDIERALA